MDPQHLQRARTLIAETLVWDNHGCMPLRPGDTSFLPQLQRYREAGVDAVSLNVGFGPQSLDEHVRVLGSMRRWLAQHADQYVLAHSVADIDNARAAGKLAVFFDIEGMGPLDPGDDGLVQLLRDLGVGWMLVAYNKNTAVGAGCYDEDAGLTAYGRRVLAEMKRVGMMVCCSHTGERTALDVCAEAGNPVILSHSNADAVYGHTRNVSDRLIRAVAETGGVVGINGIGVFLGDNDDNPERFVEHVDHVAQLVGARHVGLGIDYVFDQQELADYLATMRETFPDDASYAQKIRLMPPEAIAAVTAGLLARGWSDDDLRGFLGGNWRRVAAAVWR